MGADLYIRSISDAANAAHKPAFDIAVAKRNSAKSQEESDAAQKEVDEAYDKMYPDDGYYRDSYNGTSILWRLGLSWWTDVIPSLDDDNLLKGEALTNFRDQVRDAKLPPIDEKTLRDNNCRVSSDGDDSVSSWNEMFKEKRDRLVRFLTKAIELGEGVYCSL